MIATETWGTYDGLVAIFDKHDKLVSAPGGSEPRYDGHGKLEKTKYDGHTFLNPHDVCVGSDENLYIAQWYSGKTYPVRLERIA